MRDQIQNKCSACNGSGYKLYGSTATWHDYFIAGCAMTWDICNECWGSGDTDNPWLNLKLLDIKMQEAEQRVQKLVTNINKTAKRRAVKKGTYGK